MDCLVVLVTCRDEGQARMIADHLVETRLAACVNILPRIVSVFHWEGAVQHADEVLLMAKTRADRFDAVRDKIKQLHSYEVPEIIGLPVPVGDPAYCDWVRRESQGQGESC